MITTQPKSGYIHVDRAFGNFVHGDNKLGTVPLQPDGQWDAYLPPTHQQNENGFEPSDCVTEATINCVQTLQMKEYGVCTDWARRFLAKNSGTDILDGNDPQTVSQALKNGGCVYTSDYPFTSSNFKTFYQTLSQGLKSLGIGKFAAYSYGHSWVKSDQQSMMDALTYSPLSAAGFAWSDLDSNGYYITPLNAEPEHDFEIYGYDRNNYWKIRDSYAPFEKKLAWDFKFTGIKRHTLNRQVVDENAFTKFLKDLWNALFL